MEIDLTIKNYRCFSDISPARISLRPGFSAFVGINNVGKSTLLKFFYEYRSLFFALSSATGNLLGALRGQPQNFTSAPAADGMDINQLFCNLNNRDLQIELGFASPDLPAKVIITVPRGTPSWTMEIELSNGELLLQDSVQSGLRFDGTKLMGGDTLVTDFAPLFDAFTRMATTLYVGAFRNAINIQDPDVNRMLEQAAQRGVYPGQTRIHNYYDIQVGRILIEEWRKLKTGNNRKDNEAAAKLEDDIRRIFGFRSLSINPSQDGNAFQVFVDGRSYELSELGAGLSQFFLVLANAVTRNPSYILIDEPELGLHPSLQLDFLTTLASYAKEGILFATHSIGLARASANRVYSLQKTTEGNSIVTNYEETPRLAEFLGELSFSGYRELGFDKILLVEGPTEVQTIQQFLRLYGKDHKVVLLPLGGASLIRDKSQAELAETKRISDNVFALIDSERNAEDAPLGAALLFANLGGAAPDGAAASPGCAAWNPHGNAKIAPGADRSHAAFRTSSLAVRQPNMRESRHASVMSSDVCGFRAGIPRFFLPSRRRSGHPKLAKSRGR